MMRFVTRAPRSLSMLIGGAIAVWVATLSPRVPLLEVADAASLAQAPAARRRRHQPDARSRCCSSARSQATHPAAGIYQAIGAPLARKGIQLTPVLSPAALSADRLALYDAILIYGNHTTLAPDQEKALLDFVESGKGVVALHSAVRDVRRIRALHDAHRRPVRSARAPAASSPPRSSSRLTLRCRASSRLRRGMRPSC